MSEHVFLTLPIPPRELSPNARVHWARKAGAVRDYRYFAEMKARTLPMHMRPGWKRAEARVVFWMPDRRRRDRDNLAAMLKPAWDGLVDAGVLYDDAELIPFPPEIRCDRDNPRVEITIREQEDAA